MGYTEELRTYIGTRPIIMVGANAIIISNRGNILLHHRVDRDWWGLPGGAMEIGETTEETAKREVFEEVGLNLEKVTLFNVYSGSDLYYKYPDGNEVYNVTITYLCEEYTGEIVVDKTEGRDAKFFDLGNLPSNISYTVRPIIEEFINSIATKVL